ncbi:MAG: TatD family deoxyribonuclease [Candidatus Heimdallarchaeota archaeon]|nr:TatD family deoxyribonuclease [Candidatus Heimdallarchaeota archaeon]
MEYIDCHCHLSDNVFFRDIEAYLLEWEKIGIKIIGTMATNFKTSIRNIELAKKCPNLVKAGIGRHPWGAHKFDKKEQLLFDELIQKNDFQIIGEIGLDHYFIKEEEKKYSQQELVFKYFLGKANEIKKPIMIHLTGAENLIADILTTYKLNSNICCHWFSGEKSILKKLIDLNSYFTINPAFLRSKNHKQVIEQVEVTRLLPESDGPLKFMDEIGSPSIMPILYEKIALKLKLKPEKLSEILLSNFQNYLL